MLAGAIYSDLGKGVNPMGKTAGGAGVGTGPVPNEPLWDAVVVGAGPAGALTAYELVRMGRKVLLLDRQVFPRWKVCGATLSPGALHILAGSGLGPLLHRLDARPLHTLRLGGWSTRTELPLNGSLALSRTSLDSALVEAAEREGAHFCSGARARLLDLRDDRRVLGVNVGPLEVEVSARVVIAADGLASGLMAQAGVPSQPPTSPRRPVIGLGGVFPPSVQGFDAGVIHMAVGPEGYVGLVRVEDGSLNAAAALDPRALGKVESPTELVNSLLMAGGWPPLPGPSGDGWKGTPELTRRPRRPGAERLYAVGDASGYVEPFTGEGMFWAMAGARLLAPLAGGVGEGWEPGLLDAWVKTHGRLVGRAQRHCRLVAWTLARPSLTRALLQLLAAHPRLADPLVRRIGAPIASLA